MNEQLPKEENFEPCYCWRCDGKVPAPCPHGTGTRTSNELSLVRRIEDCLLRLWIDRVVSEASARGLLREAADALKACEQQYQAAIAEVARLTPEPCALRSVVQAVVDWNMRYPSGRVYDYGAIKKIAAEMDVIFQQAKTALAGAAPPPGLRQIAEQIRNTARVSEDSDQMLVPREVLGQLAAVLRATSTKGEG